MASPELSERAATDAHGTVLWAHSHFLLPTGGTKYVFEVVRRLAERRPVAVAVEQTSDYWRERYAAAGVPLHEIARTTSTSKTYWATFPRHLRADRRALDDLVARTGATALVSSFFPLNHLFAEIGAARDLRHVHLCFEPFPFFHDREVTGLYPITSRALMRGLGLAYGRLDRDGVMRADALLTLNEVTRRAIERVYGRTDAVPVYAGVDHAHFHPFDGAQLDDLRQRHGPGPFAIHSTDFSPIKRTDLALRAFAAAGVREARLLVTSTIDDVAGIAAMRADAEALGIGDRVDYLGFVAYEDLPRYYALADVLLQTGTSVNSGATSMSLPVKEALACGTAVIRSQATEEDVEDGVSGYLVDPADVEATAARVGELLRDPARARAFGAAGRERIVAVYRWERVVHLFDEAIG